LVEAAKKKQVRISFDPNLRLALWKDKAEMVEVINALAIQANIVLPGISEGKILTGSDDPETIADFYLKQGVEAVIVKVGSKGAFVKTKAAQFMIPAFKVDHVVDTVGAGDGFAVGVVSALLEGQKLQEAVTRGAAIGALAVMSPGDNEGLPTVAGLEKFFYENKK
jgi:2-dehydro-3-deoxygluconokinase